MTKAYKPHVNSRPWKLLRLKPGESLYLESPQGQSQGFMQQISVDIGRADLRGQLAMTLILGVEPATRTITEIIRITRKDHDQDHHHGQPAGQVAP